MKHIHLPFRYAKAWMTPLSNATFLFRSQYPKGNVQTTSRHIPFLDIAFALFCNIMNLFNRVILLFNKNAHLQEKGGLKDLAYSTKAMNMRH